MDVLDTGAVRENGELEGFAAATARLLRVTGRGGGRRSAALLKAELRAAGRCHALVEKRFGALPAPPPGCAWLLDNWDMLAREARLALRQLRAAHDLPLCGERPRIEELCRALVRSGQGTVTAERCELFLRGFQTASPLERRELRFFGTALRASILSRLCAVAEELPFAADTGDEAMKLQRGFGSLRFAVGAELAPLVRRADRVSALLDTESAGVYPHMDLETQESYLLRLEKLARREGLSETELARRLLREGEREGKHLGFLLFEENKGRGARWYIAANLLLTLVLSLLPALSLERPWLAGLLVLPVSELVKELIDALLLRIVPPRRLPRMDLSAGVPEEGKTLLVVSLLLDSPEAARRAAGRLEELRLQNRAAGPQLLFGLLADLPAAKTEETAADAAILQAAEAETERLNRAYGGGFFFFTRPRSFDGQEFTGHERKRGALLALAKLVCDRPSSLRVSGEKDALVGVRYLLTLDGDTRVYPGAALELIAAALHPLNRPELDRERGLVRRGYGLLHPRMATELSSANATDFALVFAGPGGSDPYGGLCSELMMDAFDSGGFSGKGLIDAEALLCCTAERLPEGRILSHDALEGAYLHGAWLGDAEFSDRFPTRPLSYYERLHRWTRGDWQNAPWIFARELREIDRWRLLDSLRRSLVSPLTFTALLLGFLLPRQELRLAAWAALLSLLGRLFFALAEEARRRRAPERLRRYSRLLQGLGGAIVQCFLKLWLLPWDAWVCLSAAVTALWRSLVSHKKLLQWKTAAQAEQGGQGLFPTLRALWPAVLSGLVCLFFSPTVLGRAAGLLWLLSPLCVLALSLPSSAVETLSHPDRAWLTERARETWRYFEENCTALDHFLPPDNVQAQPPLGAAHRTSPTNLGLAGVSAVAACDLGLISPEEAVGFIERLLDSMDALPRCRGHFYNWYDTLTLLPLHPAMVSTVDSGNLCACLIVLRRFLSQQGSRAETLCASFLRDMDFSFLYDAERSLFFICYDPAEQSGRGGWYDLMASEALLTSYLAIARGDVPVKHWRRLSRAQLQCEGYRGLASWTGTMFEYLMPLLFLPLERGSLLYESSRFCLRTQRRRCGPGLPLGLSESAYYAFDALLSYRYKAHGAPAAALKRGMDRDLVLSPYAAFLALAVKPGEALRDLRRYERRGMLGRWGFWEALDLTPSRVRNEDGERVQCVMAHHAGMSLLAAANALCEGSIVRRFLAEPSMSACRLLLAERLPEDPAVLRRGEAESTRRPVPAAERFERCGAGEDGACCLLSNGIYSLLPRSEGRVTARLREHLPYLGAAEWSLDGRPMRTEGWRFGEDRALYLFPGGSEEISAAPEDWGERRLLRLKSESPVRRELCFAFTPALCRTEDHRDHPAFWRLGLEAVQERGSLLLRRLERGAQKELWLCVSCSHPARFEAEPGRAEGPLSRPRVRCFVELTLSPGREETLRLALCLAPTRREALAGAQRILLSAENERGSMVSAAATALGLGAGEIGGAMELLSSLLRFHPHAAPAKQQLWAFGLSGELPILCCHAGEEGVSRLLRQFLLLKSCGFVSELVLLSREGGEYRQPFRQRLEKALDRYGLLPLLGARGGVHLLPLSAEAAVLPRAAVIDGRAAEALPSLPRSEARGLRRGSRAPQAVFRGRSLCFEAGRELPPKPWQQLLTNGHLTALVTELGPAALWLENAHEMVLTPPLAEPESTQLPEELYLEGCGSLFAPCRVRYEPGLAVWEKDFGQRHIKTSAFVPPEKNCRVLIVEGAEGLRLHWRLRFLEQGAAQQSGEEGCFMLFDPERFLPCRFLACASEPMTLAGPYAPAALDAALCCQHLTVLVCGCGEAKELKELCRASAALSELSRTVRFWATRLSETRPALPEALGHYLEGWCAYQTIAGRLYARGSLYQRGGAFGFRDQLQDAVNLLPLEAELAKEQLRRCARHQYLEGDVQHWWHEHPEGDLGLRSRCSDDLLWLVWGLCETVEASGDERLCFETEPWLCSEPLRDAERDRYERAGKSERSDTLLSHAERALSLALQRGVGPHGLPWFGSGDWNDGMDRVEGESLWLGWFLGHCCLRFASLCRRLGREEAGRYEKEARRLAAACEQSFNGRFYPRGWWRGMDDNRLDSVAQSWAVLSGLGAKEHANTALTEALHRLWDENSGLVRLCDPPYEPGEGSPGYIAGYGRGFRENGGQYTHAAVWLALALGRAGRKEEGKALLLSLLPENRQADRYGAEPYVLPADVCAAPGHEGEAGWTWYTGSAGWFYRAARELFF